PERRGRSPSLPPQTHQQHGEQDPGEDEPAGQPPELRRLVEGRLGGAQRSGEPVGPVRMEREGERVQGADREEAPAGGRREPVGTRAGAGGGGVGGGAHGTSLAHTRATHLPPASDRAPPYGGTV